MQKTKSQPNKLYGAKIKDFGRVVTGKTPPTKNQEYYGDRFPFITPTDISDSSIFVSAPERYLSDEGATKVASSKLPANSVCYTCIASVGKIAITKEESFTNQQINSIIVDSQKADYRYVFYLLKDITPQIKGMVGGAASPIINKSAFENIDVDILDHQSQKSVADILYTYDNLIENNTRRIKILEEMARAIYREWFVYFRFPGHEKAKSRSERNSATGIKMIDSKTEFGKIPEGWEVKKIKDLGEVITGKTPPKKDPDNFGVEIPFIKTPDLHNNIFSIETKEGLSVKGAGIQKNKMLPAGSLIVSCIGTLGVVAITSKKSQTNQQINAIVFSDHRYLEYGYFLLIDLRQTLRNIGANGATMGNVNKTKFESIEMLFPETKIVFAYHKRTKGIFDEILNLQKRNIILRQARDLLLPKLVTGEIEV